MTGKSKVLIVMPAHNEEGSIGGTIDEIKSALPSFDILIVDDYSTDATCKIAEEKGARVMKLPYNMGVAGAREADNSDNNMTQNQFQSTRNQLQSN